MRTADDYIDSVLKHMPRATPLRSQIALELRGHFAERVATGQSLDDIVDQLGDPSTLAESYLSAVPLVGASVLAPGGGEDPRRAGALRRRPRDLRPPGVAGSGTPSTIFSWPSCRFSSS